MKVDHFPQQTWWCHRGLKALITCIIIIFFRNSTNISNKSLVWCPCWVSSLWFWGNIPYSDSLSGLVLFHLHVSWLNTFWDDCESNKSQMIRESSVWSFNSDDLIIGVWTSCQPQEMTFSFLQHKIKYLCLVLCVCVVCVGCVCACVVSADVCSETEQNPKVSQSGSCDPATDKTTDGAIHWRNRHGHRQRTKSVSGTNTHTHTHRG